MKNAQKEAAQPQVRELVKPVKAQDAAPRLVESYCESRNICQIQNFSVETEEDIIF